MDSSELPELGDVVVVKVKRVLDYGVFVDLLEFDNQQGFIHISEIASRWVKNIRNHVKENQVRAAKVLSIKRDKNQIDLSLTKVSSGLQRATIDDWKKTKRTQKLVELMAQKKKTSFEVAWKEIAEPLLQKFDSLYEAFQEVSLKGKSAVQSISPQWQELVLETCKTSIEVPQKTVEVELSLSSMASNGVEQIKKVLQEAKNGSKEKIEIFYAGAGKYSVRITAPTFKEAEKDLDIVTEKAVQTMIALGGKADSKRIER
ncbi:S1 RNA-binding domain-containing protein [Candidatus Micrarchaeota archaeon]|nr:S1 RNA-binding domain-containing protein [Candidatus Micrarchaeota archaeon]MBU1929951.1 S1 RNA-binding domain-containing protein [Candidatus Micrarchaeota archaeon]